MNLALFVEFDTGLLHFTPLLMYESLRNLVERCILMSSTTMLKQSVLANDFLMDQLCDFSDFVWLFYFGAFLTMKTTFFWYTYVYHFCRQ